jgi:hypothetical protein
MNTRKTAALFVITLMFVLSLLYLLETTNFDELKFKARRAIAQN